MRETYEQSSPFPSVHLAQRCPQHGAEGEPEDEQAGACSGHIVRNLELCADLLRASGVDGGREGDPGRRQAPERRVVHLLARGPVPRVELVVVSVEAYHVGFRQGGLLEGRRLGCPVRGRIVGCMITHFLSRRREFRLSWKEDGSLRTGVKLTDAASRGIGGLK